MCERAIELGADLSAVIRAVGAPLVSVTGLSSRGGPEPRWTTFRLRFAGGRRLKAICLDTPEQAEAVDRLSRPLATCGVPQVLARSGATLLLPWIDGRPLDTVRCTLRIVRRCGTLHGLVHNRRVGDIGGRRRADAVERWHRRLTDGLAVLVASGALEDGEAQRATAVARQHAPRSWRRGFVLGDFCAENIVMRSSGELCIIDNETLSIGPCDYDLARTWYRWPMTRAARAAYLNGYAVHRSVRRYIAHFPFWAIMAVVQGAVFRQRMHAPHAALPVQRLRALLHDLDRGRSPDELPYRS